MTVSNILFRELSALTDHVKRNLVNLLRVLLLFFVALQYRHSRLNIRALVRSKMMISYGPKLEAASHLLAIVTSPPRASYEYSRTSLSRTRLSRAPLTFPWIYFFNPFLSSITSRYFREHVV